MLGIPIWSIPEYGELFVHWCIVREAWWRLGGELYYAPVQALRGDPGWSLRPTYAVNPLHRQIQMKA